VAVLVETLQRLFESFPGGIFTRAASHKVDLVLLRYAALRGEDRLSPVDDFERGEPRGRLEADAHYDQRLVEVFRPILAIL
jgi:hypothetical protein